MYLGSGFLYRYGKRNLGPKIARRSKGRKSARKPFRRFVPPIVLGRHLIGKVKNFRITPNEK